MSRWLRVFPMLNFPKIINPFTWFEKMKHFSLLFVLFTFVLPSSFASYIEDDYFENYEEYYDDGISFVTLATIKINYDGSGTLTAKYDNGRPVSLTFYYKSKSSFVNIEKTLAQFNAGETIIFKHPKDKNKAAMILEPVPSYFKSGDSYFFNLKAMSDFNTNEFINYRVGFYSDSNSPVLFYNNKQIKKIEISPRVSHLKWDGSFTGVEFK